MKGWISGLVALALLAGGVGQAGATIIQLASPAGFNGVDTTLNYPGADGTTTAYPLVLSGGGNTLTFTDANSQAFLRVDQGNTWTPGAYPNGTTLIWNLDPNTNQTGGAVTITFASGVHEVGFSVQQDNTNTGTTTWTFGVNGASTGFTAAASNTAGAPNGVLTFIGLQDTADNGITSLTISSTDTSSLGKANDFVLGPVTFGVQQQAAVPEPSPLVLGGLCSLGAVVVGWRRRARAAA
jgi:hypothetical protein